MAEMADHRSAILQDRQSYAQRRLEELTTALAELDSLKGVENLCIYATGSFGRLEASPHSDVDLFFVQTADSGAALGRIDKTLLDADVIRAARQLGFPEFSRDGVFLEVHQLGDVLSQLGGQEDDARNYFTARLLLLLESRPVFGRDVYSDALRQIIDAYYRDYQDHEKDFRPVFLTNDIVRFWKTLCLNYEHRRNRRSEDPGRRAKSHLKNLKLKFSRMLTCYSTLVWIARQSTGPGPDELLEMTTLTPLQRLQSVADFDATASTIVNDALSEYSWFLDTVGRSERELLDWIQSLENRDVSFDHARHFGQLIFELIVHLANGKPFLRYTVV